MFEMTCVGTLFEAAVNDFRETVDDYVQQELKRAERTRVRLMAAHRSSASR